MRGKKPSLSHIRVFRCLKYEKIDSGQLRKLDDIHLGIEPGSKAYRLYNPISKIIVVNRDVIFDGKSCWNWKGDNDEARDKPGMVHMSWGTTQDNGSGPFVVRVHYEDKATEPETETNETEEINSEGVDEQEYTQEVRPSTRQTSRPCYLEDYVLLSDIKCEFLLLTLNDEPLSLQEKLKDKRWKVACVDEIDSI